MRRKRKYWKQVTVLQGQRIWRSLFIWWSRDILIPPLLGKYISCPSSSDLVYFMSLFFQVIPVPPLPGQYISSHSFPEPPPPGKYLLSLLFRSRIFPVLPLPNKFIFCPSFSCQVYFMSLLSLSRIFPVPPLPGKPFLSLLFLTNYCLLFLTSIYGNPLAQKHSMSSVSVLDQYPYCFSSWQMLWCLLVLTNIPNAPLHGERA